MSRASNLTECNEVFGSEDVYQVMCSIVSVITGSYNPSMDFNKYLIIFPLELIILHITCFWFIDTILTSLLHKISSIANQY